MGTSDNFCLRWNNFESNISTSFRELRRDSEFFDVTLCCDNGNDKVSAHKVILAACSPLFRRILQNNSGTPNPLLYLKGVHKKELTSVLNFMYHGEVNVAQENLNTFLAVAEELAVKGLTTDSKPEGGFALASRDSAADGDNNQDDETGAADFTPKGKRPLSSSSSATRRPARSAAMKKRQTDSSSDGPDDVKRVKSEPDVVVGEDGGAAGTADDFVGEEGGPDFGGEGFDESYGLDDLEDTAGGGDASGSGEVTKGLFPLSSLDFKPKSVRDCYGHKDSEGHWHCKACEFRSPWQSNLRAHVESKHFSPGYPCPYCGKVFSIRNTMSNHMRMFHGHVFSGGRSKP